MEAFIKQYGAAILAVVATIALIGLIVGVINSPATLSAFQGIVDNFFGQATSAAGM